MMDNGKLPKERLRGVLRVLLADLSARVRFGVGEAHGRGEMMEFNFFVEQGAVRRDASGNMRSTSTRCRRRWPLSQKSCWRLKRPGMVLAGRRGSRSMAICRAQLSQDLAKTRDIPVDLDPKFSFKDKVE